MFKFVLLFAMLAVAHGGLVTPTIWAKDALPLVSAPIITTKVINPGWKSIVPIIEPKIIEKELPLIKAPIISKGFLAPAISPIGWKGWI